MSIRRITAFALVASGLAFLPMTAEAAPADLGVAGNRLTAGSVPIALHGVNRSGTEYACAQGWGFFDGPSTQHSINSMLKWRVNAVRVPLNESCWLGINGVKPRFAGAAYQAQIIGYVARLHAAGLYVILDLHWAGPGTSKALGQIPMADADHSPDFWRSVASTFASDPAVLFDLYNEPFGIDWECWLNGCDLPAGGRGLRHHPAYHTAGMQSLVDAVRSTGATQPLMVGGLDYAGDLSGWLSHRPVDPLNRLAAAQHNYGKLGPCDAACRDTMTQVAETFPVVVGEVGQTDCRGAYTDQFMGFADSLGISYLAWSWNAVGNGLTCTNGPALLLNYRGKPTRFGKAVRGHLQRVAG